jgi:hypothetical protein
MIDVRSFSLKKVTIFQVPNLRQYGAQNLNPIGSAIKALPLDGREL